MSAEGLDIALTLVYPDTTKHKALAEIVQAGWESLGIKVKLQAKPYDQVLIDLENRTYETALVDINLTRSPDPDPYPFWGQAQIQSGQNYSEWDNRSASEFLEQARMTVDFGERERLYRNFQVLFMRELPSFPLFYSTFTYGISKDIQGINLGPIFEPSDRFNNVTNWYILTSRETSTTATVDQLIPVEE